MNMNEELKNLKEHLLKQMIFYYREYWKIKQDRKKCGDTHYHQCDEDAMFECAVEFARLLTEPIIDDHRFYTDDQINEIWKEIREDEE